MEGPAKTLCFVCAPIVAGSLVCCGALHFWRAGGEVRERGVTIQATVAKKLRKGGGLENYYARFTFVNLQGRQEELELKVRSRAWRMLREGGIETITYLPDQPEKAEVGPKWGKQLLGWVFLFFALVGGSMAVTGLVLLIRLLVGKLQAANG